MKPIEEAIIENQVSEVIMPEIKKMIPGVIGFLLRAIFPKLEKELIEKIKALFEVLLSNRK